MPMYLSIAVLQKQLVNRATRKSGEESIDIPETICKKCILVEVCGKFLLLLRAGVIFACRQPHVSAVLEILRCIWVFCNYSGYMNRSLWTNNIEVLDVALTLCMETQFLSRFQMTSQPGPRCQLSHRLTCLFYYQ